MWCCFSVRAMGGALAHVGAHAAVARCVYRQGVRGSWRGIEGGPLCDAGSRCAWTGLWSMTAESRTERVECIGAPWCVVVPLGLLSLCTGVYFERPVYNEVQRFTLNSQPQRSC